ncbi:methyltransferase family protein [Dyella subtropica]|uniref:methyltransferase family protein n=1 Tax=Dyella subtropica TaxID=2992127 RepID=UPI002259F0FD|nr:isoprenylcysteine carboxylmethyltransferase family protein [Dyella subtropica]
MLKLLAVVRGFVCACGFVWLWAWVVTSVRPLDARLGLDLPVWLQVPGLLLAIVGAVIDLWCVGAFALVGQGTPAPFDAPREFVGVGLYRYVRNPMYLGAIAVISGAGLMLRSPSAVAVAGLFALLAHAFALLHEEPALERRFGESYRRYKASVNRWLPRRPRRAV